MLNNTNTVDVKSGGRNGMLVLKRRDGQWVRITNRKNNEEVWVRVYAVKPNGELSMAIDDPDNNFEVQREERIALLEQNKNHKLEF